MSNELKDRDFSSMPLAITLFSTISCIYSLHHGSPRYLEPIYGNVFPYLYLNQATALFFVLGCTIGSFQEIIYRRTSDGCKIMVTLFNATALLLALAPFIVDHLFRFSSQWGPLWGPHITQLALLYSATLFLGTATGISGREWIKSQKTVLQVVNPAISLCLVYPTCQLFRSSPIFQSSCRLILVSSSMLLIASLFSSVICSRCSHSRKRLSSHLTRPLPHIFIAAVLVYTSTKAQHCGNCPATNQSLSAIKWMILDKVESITGWVEVVEETQLMNMRVMRSGHSILGGRFRDTGDSIFATFHLLEAVRVFDRPESEDNAIRALQIGLGCGISTDALLSQGIDVDVVELDPAVYHMARDYFGLSKPSSIHLESGRTFLESSKAKTYDFVLHDIFTGGSVAPGMFSIEVLGLIKNSLKENGILAMNFVGSEQAQYREGLDMIATTLNAVFHHVKCYRDTEDSSVKFTNYMFLAADFPLSFHPLPDVKRFFSKRTAEILSQLDKMLVKVNSNLTKGIITDHSLDKLKSSGVDAAKEHWIVMRQIFGDDFWLAF